MWHNLLSSFLYWFRTSWSQRIGWGCRSSRPCRNERLPRSWRCSRISWGKRILGATWAFWSRWTSRFLWAKRYVFHQGAGWDCCAQQKITLLALILSRPHQKKMISQLVLECICFSAELWIMYDGFNYQIIVTRRSSLRMWAPKDKESCKKDKIIEEMRNSEWNHEVREIS